ncbi:MAG: hypothetical protein QNJ94_08275 [Alphaproteobacteria bacterium]|nr:hypothetical protein [Alphaproteobacteria bacterium]
MWRAQRQPRPVAGEIDAGLIAAYLDGGLREAEREAVEVWLAATPEAFEALISARAALADGERPTVPREVVARARRLVGADGRPRADEEQVRARSGWLPIWRGVLEWSVAASLLVVASIAGFQFGLESAAPTAPTIEIATGEPESLEMWAPNDGLFEPYEPGALDPNAFIDGDAS